MTESRTRVFVLATASLGLTVGISVLALLTPLGIPVWPFYLTPSRGGLFALVLLRGTRAIAPTLVTVGHAI